MNEEERKRLKELSDALALYKLRVRKDSSLCSAYVYGTTNMPLNRVVERMCQMNYLFKYCRAEKYLVGCKEWHVEGSCNRQCDLNVDIDLVGKRILKRIGGYPKTWPWM